MDKTIILSDFFHIFYLNDDGKITITDNIFDSNNVKTIHFNETLCFEYNYQPILYTNVKSYRIIFMSNIGDLIISDEKSFRSHIIIKGVELEKYCRIDYKNLNIKYIKDGF